MWESLVSDAAPWTMYYVFMSGLLYGHVQSGWIVMTCSYLFTSCLTIILVDIPVPVEYIVFTFPVATVVGIFCGHVILKPTSEWLHLLPPLVSCIAGVDIVGYPVFFMVYIVSCLVMRMYRWTIFSGLCMMVIASLVSLHSPLISLAVPVIALFLYGAVFDVFDEV